MIRLFIIISLFLFSQNVFGQELTTITCIGNGEKRSAFFPGNGFKNVGNSKIVQKITFSNNMIKSISTEIIGSYEPKVEEVLNVMKADDNTLHIFYKDDTQYYNLIENQVTKTKIRFYTYVIKKKHHNISFISTKIDRTTGLYEVQISVAQNWQDVKKRDNTTIMDNVYDADGDCKKITKNKF